MEKTGEIQIMPRVDYLDMMNAPQLQKMIALSKWVRNIQEFVQFLQLFGQSRTISNKKLLK